MTNHENWQNSGHLLSSAAFGSMMRQNLEGGFHEAATVIAIVTIIYMGAILWAMRNSSDQALLSAGVSMIAGAAVGTQLPEVNLYAVDWEEISELDILKTKPADILLLMGAVFSYALSIATNPSDE